MAAYTSSQVQLEQSRWEYFWSFEWLTNKLQEWFYWVLQKFVDFGAWCLDTAADFLPTFAYFDQFVDSLGPAPVQVLKYLSWAMPIDVVLLCFTVITLNYSVFYVATPVLRFFGIVR